MGKALVFPGQGSQTIGMGRELAETYQASRMAFEEVDEALGQKLSDVIWNGDMETLTLTSNAQPALMATSMAAFRALQEEGLDLDSAAFVAGHSLGEYSALCAAGSISLGDTARLLRVRGRAMQDAVPAGAGAMAAIVGLGIDEVEEIAESASEKGICETANDNDPRQVVVSGERGAVEFAAGLAKERGARRAVLLPVSAPFHCELMEPAAERMKAALASVEIFEARIPVVSNVLARPETSPRVIRDLLIRQVTGTVRWRESVDFLALSGVRFALELGSGSVLTGLIRRTRTELRCNPVGRPDQVRSGASQWKESI